MLVIVLLFFLLRGLCGAEECQSRDYGNGGTVCVCNSNHCDTLIKPNKIEQPHYLIYTSNKKGLRFNKSTGTFQETNQISANQIIINHNEKYQKIIGWGGAFTDATGINIKSLNDKAQDNLLKSYFSDDGIEYSLCRVPIGGTVALISLFVVTVTTMVTLIKNWQILSWQQKILTINKTQFIKKSKCFTPFFQIPYIKKATDLTHGNLKLFASAWTAPKWMKTNGAYSGFGFLLESMYQTWANYFVKFLDHYQQQNISFWGITTGNEPSLGYLPFQKINSVGWTPSLMAKWILNNLGPTIRNSKYSDIKIMALDDQRFFLPWFLNIALKDNDTRNYIDGIAVHWYYDFIFSPNLLLKTHENFPEKFILGTEACNGDKAGQKHIELGSWERGEKYADDIIQDVSNWVTGWVDWNMALDLTGGPTYIENYVDSPIIVNASAGEFYKQPTFYNLGHFSKFVPRDSIRIKSSSFDQEVPTVAFQTPDNGTVVVILNKKNEIVPVAIVDDLRGTSDVELTEKSITTILYW